MKMDKSDNKVDFHKKRKRVPSMFPYAKQQQLGNVVQQQQLVNLPQTNSSLAPNCQSNENGDVVCIFDLADSFINGGDNSSYEDRNNDNSNDYNDENSDDNSGSDDNYVTIPRNVYDSIAAFFQSQPNELGITNSTVVDDQPTADDISKLSNQSTSINDLTNNSSDTTTDNSTDPTATNTTSTTAVTPTPSAPPANVSTDNNTTTVSTPNNIISITNDTVAKLEGYKGLIGLILVIVGVMYGVSTVNNNKGYFSMIISVLSVVGGGYLLYQWNENKNNVTA